LEDSLDGVKNKRIEDVVQHRVFRMIELCIYT